MKIQCRQAVLRRKPIVLREIVQRSSDRYRLQIVGRREIGPGRSGGAVNV